MSDALPNLPHPIVHYPFPPSGGTSPQVSATPAVFRLTLNPTTQNNTNPTDISTPQIIQSDPRGNWSNLDPTQAQVLPNGDLKYTQQLTTQTEAFNVLNQNENPSVIDSSPENSGEFIDLEQSIQGKQLTVVLQGPASMTAGSELAGYSLDMQAATAGLQPGEVRLLKDFGEDGYIVAMGAEGNKAIIGIENLHGGQQINALDGSRNGPATPNKSFVTTMTDAEGQPAFVTVRTDANGDIAEVRLATNEEVSLAQQGRVQNTDSLLTIENTPATVETIEHIVRQGVPPVTTQNQTFDFALPAPFEAFLLQWQQLLGQPYLSISTVPPVEPSPPATSNTQHTIVDYPFVSD